MPHLAICRLSSTYAYSSSRNHEAPKREKESFDGYEKRTWRLKAHFDAETRKLYIPGIQFKFAIGEAAKRLGEKVPGKGSEKWGRHFEAGVIVIDPIVLPVTVDEVEGETLWCNPQGIRGGGKRVKRTFPIVRKWEGDLTVHVLDELIDQAIFTRVLQHAGRMVGVGRGRIGQGGYYNGTFRVDKVTWKESPI